MKIKQARRRPVVGISGFRMAMLIVAALTVCTVNAAAEFCDGDFEDGPFSDCWETWCDIRGTPWCSQDLCNDEGQPRSPIAWHWHGGITFETEECTAKQGPIEFHSKTVTTDGLMNAWVDDVSLTDDELVFWLQGQRGGDGVHEGWLRVLVEGEEVWRVDHTEINDYRDRYFRISVPLDGCTLAVKSQKLSVTAGRKLPVRLTVKHRRPTETTTAFVLTLRDGKGRAVATQTTREYTFRYGSKLRKTARFTVPPDTAPGHYTLEARLDGMKQGRVVASDGIEVR